MNVVLCDSSVFNLGNEQDVLASLTHSVLLEHTLVS